MKKNSIQTTDTMAKVFETVLSIPGMNDIVKIQLSIPRKNVLLLSKVIERALTGKESLNDDSILCIASVENLEEVSSISDELLKKAGLIEMNENLKAFL